MEGLKVVLAGKIQLLVDNKSTIDLAKHLVSHGRNKHIETKFHYIRAQLNNEKLEIVTTIRTVA